MYRKTELPKHNYLSSIDLRPVIDNNKFRKSPVMLDYNNRKNYPIQFQNKQIQNKNKYPKKTNYMNQYFSPKNQTQYNRQQIKMPKYIQQIKSISPRQKQHQLFITLQTNNNVHQVKYKFGEATMMKSLIQYLKQIAGENNIMFKSGNMVIDYLLTLPNQKVIILKNYNLKLKTELKIHQNYPQNSLKKFNIIKCIGSGGFSKVFFAEVNQVYVALKLINKKFLIENQKQMIVQNQRNILLSFNHPFITKVYYTIQTQKFFAIAMEYCNGGELFYLLKKVKRMKQHQAKFYFLQVLAALAALHQKNIIYRDLKPQNIIIDNQGHIRLADYGLSKIMQQQLSYSFCGSAEYMAPEMLQKSGHSYIIDLYCLGALLYQLVTGLPPFFSRDQDLLFHNILNQKLQFPSKQDLSHQIKSLLSGLLEKNPNKRLGHRRGINEILTHPWLQNTNLYDVIQKRLVPPFKPNILEYNFDDSQYAYQEAQQLKQLIKQKQTGDLKKGMFQNFYFQSGQMKAKRLQLERIAQYKYFKKQDTSIRNKLSSPIRQIRQSQKNISYKHRSYNSISIQKLYPENKELTKLLKYNPPVQNQIYIRKYDSTPNLQIKYGNDKKRYIAQQGSLTNIKKPITRQSTQIRSFDKNRRWNTSVNINNSYSKENLQNYRKWESRKFLSQNYNINNLQFMNIKYKEKDGIKKTYINKDKYKNYLAK